MNPNRPVLKIIYKACADFTDHFGVQLTRDYLAANHVGIVKESIYFVPLDYLVIWKRSSSTPHSSKSTRRKDMKLFPSVV